MKMRAAVALGALFVASSARADRGETYVVLGYEPGVSSYKLGTTGAGSATRPASVAFSAAVFRGFTNTWHVGGRLHFANVTDVHVGNAIVQMQGGSRAQGDVYEDHRAFGAGGLLLYRFDTHAPLAPVLELEGGFASHQYSRITFIPSGATNSYPQPSRSQTSVYGSASLYVEYRFATRWVASAGVTAQVESGDMPWSIRVPIRVGVIW
jgi:hypothetical protein